MRKRGGVVAVLTLALMAGCAPPFMRGVASGNVAKVQTELAHGADLNARDARGNTPLIVAALDGHNDVAVLLIAHGANVNGRNAHGGTPLMAAAYKGDTSLAALLLAHGADVNASDGMSLIIAARYGHPRVAALLMAHGANLNARAANGQTALQVADHIADPEKRQAIITLLQNPAAAGPR